MDLAISCLHKGHILGSIKLVTVLPFIKATLSSIKLATVLGIKLLLCCNFGGDKYSTVPALLTVILPTISYFQCHVLIKI